MDSIFPCQNIRARRGALRSEYSIKINDNVCTDEYAQIPFSVSEDALDQKYEVLCEHSANIVHRVWNTILAK